MKRTGWWKRKRERKWDEESWLHGGIGREKGNGIKRARDEGEEERRGNRMETGGRELGGGRGKEGDEDS